MIKVRGVFAGAVGAGVVLLAVAGHVAAQGGTVQAPRFEVDPFWPRPLPNNWLLGSVTGVAIDARDHVYVIHLTDSFTARTETGAGTITPEGGCCSSAPNVLEFDPSGNLWLRHPLQPMSRPIPTRACHRRGASHRTSPPAHRLTAS